MTDKEIEAFNELKAELKEQGQKIDAIFVYIHNDEATGRQGVVSKVDSLEHEILQIKVRNQVNSERSAAFGGIAGGVLGAVVALVQYLYKLFQ